VGLSNGNNHTIELIRRVELGASAGRAGEAAVEG
jgi:hypothetical protein